MRETPAAVPALLCSTHWSSPQALGPMSAQGTYLTSKGNGHSGDGTAERRRSHFSITLSTAKDSVLPPRRLTAQTEPFLCSHVLAHLPTVRGPLGYLHFRPPLLFLSLSLFLSPHLSPRANNSRLVGTVSQRGNTRCHWWNCCDLLLAPARGRKIDALLPEGG